MQITWHGLGCLRLQIKDTTILVDPLPTNVGLQAPRLQADIFLFTSTENPQYAKAKAANGFCIDAPGEYEARGIMMNGVASPQPDGSSLTLFTIEAEGMTIGLLGALAAPINGPQTEHLKDIDVLVVPVGGKPVLSGKQATELISALEPRLVIPVYYKVPGLSPKLEAVDAFLKELGTKTDAPQEKIRIVRKDLPEEDMRVLLLKV